MAKVVHVILAVSDCCGSKHARCTHNQVEKACRILQCLEHVLDIVVNCMVQLQALGRKWQLCTLKLKVYLSC